VLALLGAVAAAGSATAQSEEPTVRVVGGEAAPDGTTTVGVVLTSAPNGLSGYYLDVTVTDPDVARIESAGYPERFGLTTAPETEDDGATVTLEAADIEGSIEPGASEVPLATVRVAGVSAGETRLAVEPRQFDADDGTAFRPATAPGTVTVGDAGGPVSDGSEAGDGSTVAEASATDAGGDTATSGSGALPPAVAVVALLATTLLLARRT
jgi:hypothetical protein